MGGIAKGQIIREIDALGGYSGIVSDKSAIQFRMLNRSKGPAMWSPRTQNDRMLFALEWRKMLEETPNVDFLARYGFWSFDKKWQSLWCYYFNGIRNKIESSYTYKRNFLKWRKFI
ncbi:MAG: hypothetical protein KatS3mg035_1738 [Bacteroidia bacterium]|nr:MAG: hypothetical protein KatS3mg035_1738 [Bacteroidia bacterium]